MFQDDALWPRLTVAENVGYGLKVRRLQRAERREKVAEALGMLRIDSLAEKYPDDLSGLQRQRVALARALVVGARAADPRRAHRPARDPGARRVPRRDPADPRRDRADHPGPDPRPREALALADRLAVMDLGRVIQSGTPQEVYNRPADAFVARLLGPANLFQGQVEGTDARGEVVVRTTFGRLIGQLRRRPARPRDSGDRLDPPRVARDRPERPPDSNRFAATVERLVFLGEVRQVHLRGPGDWPIMALALQSQSQALREGQSLTLSVPPEQVVVLLGKYALGR